LPPSSTPPRIRTFVLGEFETNCFLVTCRGEDDHGPPRAWIVDCGYDPGEMLDAIDAEGVQPEAILLTHAHVDHIAGVEAALGRFGPLPIHLHEGERGFCSDAMLNLSALLGPAVTCREPDRWLSDGDRLTLGLSTWRVVHAPGHSPGSALFVHDESNQAIVGDTLFAGSMGRIDFPTSEPERMRHTLREVMMALPDEMTIHPGHGPATTIGRERATNPFIHGGF
jgi:glyoxylase-like metal-dependent hydrolase (beta-lactamase superfamily II)